MSVLVCAPTFASEGTPSPTVNVVSVTVDEERAIAALLWLLSLDVGGDASLLEVA